MHFLKKVPELIDSPEKFKVTHFNSELFPRKEIEVLSKKNKILIGIIATISIVAIAALAAVRFLLVSAFVSLGSIATLTGLVIGLAIAKKGLKVEALGIEMKNGYIGVVGLGTGSTLVKHAEVFCFVGAIATAIVGTEIIAKVITEIVRRV
jgi:hypothetical protein